MGANNYISEGDLSDENKLVPTQTIARAVDILKILQRGMQGVTAISDKLGMSKATTHRLIKSLEKTGLLMQDLDSKQYCLGPLLVRLASDYLNAHQNLCICARKEMQRLWELSGETVTLMLMVGLHGTCLEEYDSYQSIKYTTGRGIVTPLHVGSGSKAMLSILPDNKLKVIMNDLEFNTVGPNTITKKDMLLDEIKKSRQLGYATSFGERTPGGAGISVPIKNYVYPAAISVIGPDTRLEPKLMSLVDDMMESANRISEKLLRI
jgi:DNA-binding IclR family transcriptional regulator